MEQLFKSCSNHKIESFYNFNKILSWEHWTLAVGTLDPLQLLQYLGFKILFSISSFSFIIPFMRRIDLDDYEPK
jgi:hypothetical protein